MDRNDVNWKGYIPAITTPFDKEGNIDWKGWEHLLEWLLQEGVHGIVVNGTSGEWFSQTVEEQRDLLRRVIDKYRLRYGRRVLRLHRLLRACKTRRL
ncbi:dihydrodipicolinate synthase family protein [Paenibacillus aestuarii]|uniref:Dihydrodipicolinate synthase family protein n=1 Tax=Paenibacillus aestuarii TaxID=516965 RepID=A0ABW0KA16_9BACL|nr:dihydrodipicolinate synthase family protein [Paenibacillus aestuarii]